MMSRLFQLYPKRFIVVFLLFYTISVAVTYALVSVETNKLFGKAPAYAPGFEQYHHIVLNHMKIWAPLIFVIELLLIVCASMFL